MQIPIIMILIAVGFVLLGLFRLWKLVQQIQKKSKSQNWQPTTAEVLSKQVAKKLSTRSGVSYHPEITYRFVVMGQGFEKKIQLPKYYSSQKAQEKLDIVGTTIAVRYDPNQPKDHISEFETVNYSDILLIVTTFVVAALILFPYLS